VKPEIHILVTMLQVSGGRCQKYMKAIIYQEDSALKAQIRNIIDCGRKKFYLQIVVGPDTILQSRFV